MKKDMTLSEFMNKVDALKLIDGWKIEIPLRDGTKGNLYVKNASNEFDAKEQGFLYLQEIIYGNQNDA